jgi:hypothetical protein
MTLTLEGVGEIDACASVEAGIRAAVGDCGVAKGPWKEAMIIADAKSERTSDC